MRRNRFAIAEHSPLSNPPQSPAPATPFADSAELLSYLVTHPNVLWLNTTDVSGQAPDYQTIRPITWEKYAGKASLGVAWVNLPFDSHFSFSFPGPDKANTINTPKLPITSEAGEHDVPLSLPAGYKSFVVINWYKGKTAPPRYWVLFPYYGAD